MKFRKKPVVVEAFQMTRERRFNNIDWPEWLHKAWQQEPGQPGSLYPVEAGSAAGTLLISSPEGQLLVSLGDWIIRGVKGELYACKPDIFMQTYEPVDKAYTIENRGIKNITCGVCKQEVEKTFLCGQDLVVTCENCKSDLTACNTYIDDLESEVNRLQDALTRLRHNKEISEWHCHTK